MLFRLCVWNLASGLLQIEHKLEKWQWHHSLPTWRHYQICFVINTVLFLLASLVTSPNFMSITSLVLELCQFTFISDWPEIRKSEIPPSAFCPVSRDRGQLGISHLAWMSLIKLTKCYKMPGSQLLPFLSY